MLFLAGGSRFFARSRFPQLNFQQRAVLPKLRAIWIAFVFQSVEPVDVRVFTGGGGQPFFAHHKQPVRLDAHYNLFQIQRSQRAEVKLNHDNYFYLRIPQVSGTRISHSGLAVIFTLSLRLPMALVNFVGTLLYRRRNCLAIIRCIRYLYMYTVFSKNGIFLWVLHFRHSLLFTFRFPPCSP